MIFRNGKLAPHDKGTIRSINCEVDGKCVAVINEEIPRNWDRDRCPNTVYRVQVLDIYKCRSFRHPYNMHYTSHGSYSTLYRAKEAVEKWYSENKAALGGRPKVPIQQLPAGKADSFYPTPSKLAGIMLSRVDWRRVKNILEPSAGKGDLVEAIKSALEDNEPDSSFYGWRKHRKLRMRSELCRSPDIDVVEIDENLQQILIGKGFNLVHDDFLTYATQKAYDLIIMNPPFHVGDKHLLKAISMIEAAGGQIVCLLNAETIRNQCTNTRHMLGQRLKEYGARIEFYQNSFRNAERKTDVEIAMVTLDIPAKPLESHIWEDLKKANPEQYKDGEPTAIVSDDWVEQMVAHYNLEVDAGIALLREYGAITPYLMLGARNKQAPLICLSVGGKKDISTVDSAVINEYLRCVRSRYWFMLLNRPEISHKMTSDMSNQFFAKLDTLETYDFTQFNIRRFIIELTAQLSQGVIDSIHSLFQKLSEKHSWYPECDKNIHYYNGWRTNEAHKVGMKAIIPVNGYATRYHIGKDTKELDSYRITCGIRDLERALTYLDGGKYDICHVDVSAAVERAICMGKTTVSFTYFSATFYKKGTCHLKFYPEAKPLIDRMNIMVGRERAWLPPCYGKVRYEEMDAESRAVVDSFQTRAEYEEIYADPGYYLSNTTGFPALSA